MGTFFLAIDDLFVPLQHSLGVPSGWFFIALLFFALFALFLVLYVRKCTEEAHLQKLLKKKDDYITGLEATSDLPSVRMPESNEFASIVFDSDKERKRQKKAQERNAAKAVTAVVDKKSVIAGRINAQVPTINVAGSKPSASGVTGSVNAVSSSIPVANDVQSKDVQNVEENQAAASTAAHKTVGNSHVNSAREDKAETGKLNVGKSDNILDVNAGTQGNRDAQGNAATVASQDAVSPSQTGAIASSVHEAIYNALSQSLSEREAAAAAAAIGSTSQFMDAIKTAEQHDAQEAEELAAQKAAEEETARLKAEEEEAEKKQAEAALAACGLDPSDLEAQRILAQILSAKADGKKSKHSSSELSGAIPHI